MFVTRIWEDKGRRGVGMGGAAAYSIISPRARTKEGDGSSFRGGERTGERNGQNKDTSEMLENEGHER